MKFFYCKNLFQKKISFNFCSNNDIKKKILEQKEIENFRKNINKKDFFFSNGFLNLMIMNKLKIIFLFGFISSAIFTKIVYSLCEINYDPFEKKRHFLMISYKNEKKLAKLCREKLLLGHEISKNINDIDFITNIKQKFQSLSEINLPVNGKVFLIEKDDLFFYLLPNGDLFLSTAFLKITRDPIAISSLLGLEFAHIYLRHFTKNINFYDLPLIISFYLSGFNENSNLNTTQNFFLRQIPFFTYSEEQEKKAIQILKSYVNDFKLENINLENKDIKKILDFTKPDAKNYYVLKHSYLNCLKLI